MRGARQNGRMDQATLPASARPWLAHYPDGVPHDIDPAQYRSLAALLEESLKKNAQRPVRRYHRDMPRL